MKNGKPRGKTPSLIGGTNGKPKRASVIRRSECGRCGTNIPAGSECIVIPQNGGAFTRDKRFCDNCFKNILVKTEEDLVIATKLLCREVEMPDKN